MVAEYRTESVPIESIVIPAKRREVKKSSVETLAKSIQTNGLINPVTLTSDYRLIAGRHRLAAIRKLGFKTIDARIVDADDLILRLMEIDENMERNQLDALEFSQQMKERKDIYEAIHPETKSVNQRGGPGRGKKTGADSAPVLDHVKTETFTQNAANKLGVSQRTVQEAVHIAESIAEDVQEQIADTPIADNKSELAALAKLPESQQRKVVEQVASGKAKSVRAAAKPHATKPPKNGRPTVDVRKFVALEKHLGKAIRMNTEIKAACGGPEFHEKVRVSLNETLKTLAAWRKSLGAS